MFASYGLRPNCDLLMTYGFTLPDNENECSFAVTINLPDNKKDPLRAMKKEMLGGTELSLEMKSVPTSKDLTIFRILVFDDVDNVGKLMSERNQLVDKTPVLDTE